MPRPTSVTVLASALSHNLELLRSRAPDAAVWAVVKADAYGHGLAAALTGLAGADGLALVEFDRAAWLREAGWRGPLLMLEGAFDTADLRLAGELDLSLVVHEPAQLRSIVHAHGPALNVCLKWNSGMNRLGLDSRAWVQAFEQLQQLRGSGRVRTLTPMMHFARADEPGESAPVLEAFGALLARVGLGLQDASHANSAVLLDANGVARGASRAVRPGIACYGASPFADRDAAALGLRPAMHFESRLIGVQQVAAGESVGYGHAPLARDTRVGIVACGYADGYPRHAPAGTPVAVNGTRTATVGRVSMDMLAVDLGPVPDAGVGAPVQLWGDHVPVDEVARAAGTIGYELLCAIAPRVRRVLA